MQDFFSGQMSFLSTIYQRHSTELTDWHQCVTSVIKTPWMKVMNYTRVQCWGRSRVCSSCRTFLLPVSDTRTHSACHTLTCTHSRHTSTLNSLTELVTLFKTVLTDHHRVLYRHFPPNNTQYWALRPRYHSLTVSLCKSPFYDNCAFISVCFSARHIESNAFYYASAP